MNCKDCPMMWSWQNVSTYLAGRTEENHEDHITVVPAEQQTELLPNMAEIVTAMLTRWVVLS
jgi:hypothetical protein